MVERAGGVDGKQKIGSDNKGNKMLQKMGWKDGMGLGKKNQGRTEIVEVRTFECTNTTGWSIRFLLTSS